MKKIFILNLLSFYLLGQIFAQSPNKLSPLYEQSMGNHEHTSRDELIQMSKDPDGNLLLLGFVEGDSIFADVILQKISPEGNLFWDYRFDSDSNNNYDVPLKMAVDGEGNTTILGLSNGSISFFSPQRSNGYLLKIDTNGNLLWQIAFDTLLPPHETGLKYDGFPDTLDHFYVTYSTFVEFGDRPTYFMKFGSDGKVLHSFTKFDIAQALGGGPAALGQAVDSAGNFIFIHWDELSLPHTAIRKINAETSDEQILPFDLSGLSNAERNNLEYMDWQSIWVDEHGDIYSANNIGVPFGPAFYLSKVKASGKVSYVMKPDSIGIHFASLEIWKGAIYVTGSYIPKKSNNSVAFIWKLNDQGQREYAITESTVHDCVPRFLDIEQGNIYWATEDVYTRQVTLKELNTSNLDIQREYPLHQDQSYLFTGTNIVTLSDGLVALGGTLRKEKLSGTSYLSEEELYVETFLSDGNEVYSQYMMSETGTTHTESIALSVDRNGNKIVKTCEIYGPEYYLIQYAPRKYYYHKFTADLTPVWTIQSQHPAYYSFGVSPFYLDGVGNAYTVEVWGQDSLLLQKISPDGLYLKSYPLIGVGFQQLFIDRQDRLHLSLIEGSGNRASIVLDTEFQPLQPAINGLYPIAKFQLPSEDAVYYYMEDPVDDIGQQYFSIILLRNGQQVWERTFSFDASNQTFADFDVDKNSGALLASSFWNNAAGFPEPALHRFSIDNIYSKAVINNGIFEGVYDIALMPTGNSYVAYDSKLNLYDPNLNFVKSIPISNAPSGGNYFKTGNIFYRAHNGSLEAFSAEGLPLFALENESFSLDPAQISMENDGLMTTTSIYGELLGVGYAYGWRWVRGRIQAYDLLPLLTSKVEDPLSSSRYTIKCQPIPVTSTLQINLQDFVGLDLHLSLVSLSGVQVLDRNYEPLEQPNVHIDVSQLPAGQYILSVHAEKAVVTQKIVVLR